MYHGRPGQMLSGYTTAFAKERASLFKTASTCKQAVYAPLQDIQYGHQSSTEKTVTASDFVAQANRRVQSGISTKKIPSARITMLGVQIFQR